MAMASPHGSRPLLPRIPCAPPRWPRGDALLFAASGFVAATAAPLSVAVLRVYDQLGYLEPRHVLLPALVSGLLLAWKVLNARTVGGAVSWALLGGPIAGVIAGALTALGLLGFSERGVQVANSALLGLPFGAIFGATLAWPAGAAVRIRSRRAHDTFDRMLVALGVWLMVVYGTTFVAIGEQGLALIARIGIGFGGAAAIVGILRRAARIAWLKRVRAGRERDWALREWNGLENIDQLLPLLGARRLSCDALLVWIGGLQGAPYRGARAETAVALAPGPTSAGRARSDDRSP